MALYSVKLQLEEALLDLIEADADLSSVINTYYQGMTAQLPIGHLPSLELILESAGKETEYTGGSVHRRYSGVITISGAMQTYPNASEQKRFQMQGNQQVALIAESIERLLQDKDNHDLGNPTLTNAVVVNIEFDGETVYGPAARGEIDNNILYTGIVPFSIYTIESR